MRNEHTHISSISVYVCTYTKKKWKDKLQKYVKMLPMTGKEGTE